ncbi:MAG: SH3 domain-containing protein [Clostridia bacterium]|nr:SH3 domain-containing protein [Clostridia bacterium]
MKKRLIALMLVLILVIPAGIASAASWYRVNTNFVEVHYLPGNNSKILGRYRRDYALKINSSSADGWSDVTFSNGFNGYVLTKYLKKATSYTAWIYGDNTALRKGPDGNFTAIASLAKGRKVTVLSHGSKYDYVNAGDMGKGYVVNSRLSKKRVKPSGNKSVSYKSESVDYDAWIMSTGKVKVRKSASTTAAIVTTLKPGKKVHVTYKTANWSKIKVNGNTGWIQNKFLSLSKPADNPGGNNNNNNNSSYTAYVVTANKKPLNVRSGKGTGYQVLFKINHGEQVTVLKHYAKWDYIEYKGRKGYVMNSYLQTAAP